VSPEFALSCAGPKVPNYGSAKTRNTASIALGLRAQQRSPGTEFLEAETKRQKSSFNRANACRDQNPGNERPEIPAETPYLAPYRKPAVCGDWMVVCAVPCEPVSTEYFPVIREFNREVRDF
jgi:hypothetical protein